LQGEHDRAVADAGDDAVDLDLDAVATHGQQAKRALRRRLRAVQEPLEQRSMAAIASGAEVGDARRSQRRQRLADEQVARPSEQLLGRPVGPAHVAGVVERQRGNGQRFEQLERFAVIEPGHSGFIIPLF
jgi:hypothetical protein